MKSGGGSSKETGSKTSSKNGTTKSGSTKSGVSWIQSFFFITKMRYSEHPIINYFVNYRQRQ